MTELITVKMVFDPTTRAFIAIVQDVTGAELHRAPVLQNIAWVKENGYESLNGNPTVFARPDR